MKEFQLISSCKKGLRQAQKKLYDTYCGQMYSICLRYCKDVNSANDALQNGFVKVFKSIHQFDGRGDLGAWIRRIIVNTSLDQLKFSKSFFTNTLSDLDHEDFSYEIEIKLNDFNYQRLLKIIDLLPDGYKLVFTMFVIDNLSHAEIAEMLSISINTSRSQLLKARRMLKERIQGDEYLSQEYPEIIKNELT